MHRVIERGCPPEAAKDSRGTAGRRDGDHKRRPGSLDRTSGGSGFRDALVERVRREIRDGTYETPSRIDIAVERLLKRLGL
jgi:hypothetical protein